MYANLILSLSMNAAPTHATNIPPEATMDVCCDSKEFKFVEMIDSPEMRAQMFAMKNKGRIRCLLRLLGENEDSYLITIVGDDAVAESDSQLCRMFPGPFDGEADDGFTIAEKLECDR